ncbi:OLC1v1025974C1 [Oldenlandia corymbosa var. corymbosa]|uniref:OLC1v1025974C1 n=1 Tax=Oldenlandia corymbosa var. corymbosa TaxID=529605 RepID=A0AAV1C6I1_OLDCO|nr:OLC1v1025974C1 [Oldenlandia corymbosa var. corymbosa]
MDPPATGVEVKPENLEEAKEGRPLFHCDLFDTEIVHKIAEALLPGLASACVDNTIGGLFKTPGSVAVDIRREMVDYLFQRSENFVAESVVLEGGPDAEVSDLPDDIILEFIDDFASSKRNFFSRVSGWLLSERREDRIDDFVQEMELNGFWLIGRRETVSQTLVKNVDVKNIYHCDKKFKSPEELADHLSNCSFRIMDCMNEGCNARFSAGQFDYHDSICPFKILPCEQKCSETIMRREMDRHCITMCSMKLTKCPFYQVGCQSVIPQSTIDQHRSEHLHSHLLYILQQIHREGSIEDLNKRVDQLEKLSSIDRLVAARDARSLAYLIKDLELKLGPLEVSKKRNDDVAVRDVNETKEEKAADSSPKKESPKSPSRKEKSPDSSPEHKRRGDSSPQRSSTSSSEREDIGNSVDEKEESSGFVHVEEKSQESAMESSILEEDESTLKKEVNAESPSKEDELI